MGYAYSCEGLRTNWAVLSVLSSSFESMNRVILNEIFGGGWLQFVLGLLNAGCFWESRIKDFDAFGKIYIA